MDPRHGRDTAFDYESRSTDPAAKNSPTPNWSCENWSGVSSAIDPTAQSSWQTSGPAGTARGSAAKRAGYPLYVEQASTASVARRLLSSATSRVSSWMSNRPNTSHG